MNDPDSWVHVLEEERIDGTATTAVQFMVNELTGMIGELRGLGFPYCDELLIAIQGYLNYAGHEDIDVLPYPESGEGGMPKEFKIKKEGGEEVK